MSHSFYKINKSHVYHRTPCLRYTLQIVGEIFDLKITGNVKVRLKYAEFKNFTCCPWKWTCDRKNAVKLIEG